MRYKSKKRNVILDALSRLVSSNKSLSKLLKYYTKLNALHANILRLDIYIYIITLIEISKNFKIRVIKDY